ncbi:MAG TPA: exodeoxyribonuclease VII large subunit, partial [Anaerolineales bacterium]|nr:exodeoxyribonuclease VII large subunit [Anaerolineales bacterium]
LSPRAQLANSRQRLDDLLIGTATAIQHRLEIQHQRVDGLTRRLESLSPLAVLQRGFAVVTRTGTTEVIRSAAAVAPGDALDVRVSEGQFTVAVEPPL